MAHMPHLQMFDDVDIIGKAEDIDVPIGTRGSIVLCFEDDSYIVDIGSMEPDLCDAIVRANNLIRHNEYPELPAGQRHRSAERRKTA